MSERIACRACGKWMFHLAQVCPHCGVPQADAAPPPPKPAPAKPREPLHLSAEEARALLATSAPVDSRGSGLAELITELVAWRGSTLDNALTVLAVPLTAPTVLSLNGAMRAAGRRGRAYDFRLARWVAVPSTAALFATLLWQSAAPGFAWALLALSFVAWFARTLLRSRSPR